MLILRNNKILNNHLLNRFCQYVTKMSSKAIKEQKIEIDGQTINYLKVGEGAKNVLCFPGALGSIWSDFKPQVEGLDPKTFTIIAWDPPGYGYSRPPNRNFDIKFYEKDAGVAYNLMKNLNLPKFSLLGWSDGGISSMILAAKFPNNIEKLVIWGANSYVTPEEAKIYEKMKDISGWSDRMKAPLVALYSEKGLQDMWSSWCDTLVEISKNGGDICQGCLTKIECPTFILHGDKDPMVAPEHPGYLFSKIKHAKLHRFPDGKHNIHLKYAKEFNRLVTDFILQ